MRVLERLPREPGREYALRTLRENIISLEIEPGSQISENELAAAMGLSRTPVREALLELSRVGIVELQPQKRGSVALIDYAQIEEAQFMRRELECAVAELACGMASPEDVRALEENVKLQNFYLENYSALRLMELDDRFHETLFSIAKKSGVYRLIRGMSIHFDRVRRMALNSVKDLKIVGDHAALTVAVREGRSGEARRLMGEHLSRFRADADAIRKQYPQYFA